MVSSTTYPTLEEMMQRVSGLRPVTGVAMRVLALTESDQASAREVAAVVSADQALSVKFLRMANSAYYGQARRITTVRDAVVVLGMRTVRSAVLVSTMMTQDESEGPLDRYEFWRHCVGVGVVSEAIARVEGLDRHHAFTAGVLHNTGRLAMDQQAPEVLSDTIALALESGMPLIEAERALLGYTDADLGGALAVEWNFPEPLVDGIRLWPLPPEEQPRTLAAVVGRARTLVIACGLGDGVPVMPMAAADGETGDFADFETSSESLEGDVQAGTSHEPELPPEWLERPLSIVLARLGGPGGIVRSADDFVESTLLG
jgi:HD-like signal output (HDOD) protein